ncbi:MAG: hypothetical protein JRD93_19220 [Deltaproteobacteria bacterium]|nr:hypothetical protein [Deltaproteobacteria bacterium]
MDTINLKKNNPNYPSALKKHLGEDVSNGITAIWIFDIRFQAVKNTICCGA